MNVKYRGATVDFFIILLLYLSVSLSIFFASVLLYGRPQTEAHLSVITEELDTIYRDYVRLGDSVYDTLTKRCLGEISDLEVIDTGSGIRFKFSSEVRCMPKGKALRTPTLRFDYSILCDT